MKIGTILLALMASLLFAAGGANAATGPTWTLPEIGSKGSATERSELLVAQTKPKEEEEEEEELGEDDC